MRLTHFFQTLRAFSLSAPQRASDSAWRQITKGMTPLQQYQTAVETPTPGDYSSPQFLLYRALGSFSIRDQEEGFANLSQAKKTADAQPIIDKITEYQQSLPNQTYFNEVLELISHLTI